MDEIQLCEYGCGQEAIYQSKSGKWCCSKSYNSCPTNRKKNSEGVKKCYNDGRIVQKRKDEMSVDDLAKRGWSKGLTKYTDERIKRNSINSSLNMKNGITKAPTGRASTTEKELIRRSKISKARTEWLKNPENHKIYGSHKRSWMEENFEKYLISNKIEYQYNRHFYNEKDKKNIFADYTFEDKKLIIELDGNQHEKTIEKDKIRDNYLKDIGYNVTRINHKEFKRRWFSSEGFLDLI